MLENILNKIWGKIKKYVVIMVIEALILGGVGLFFYQNQQRQLDRANQNLIAMSDTVKEVRLKNGELLFEKSAWILKEKELSSVLDITDKELKDLKKKLGSSLEYIAFLEGSVHVDTVVTVRDSLIYINGTERYLFELKEPYIGISGYHEGNQTTFSQIEVPVPLMVGLSEDYKIFVSSSNPYVRFDGIQGAVLNKSALVRKPRFSWGIQIGVGGNYGFIHKNWDVGPYMGIGGQLNF